MPLTDTAIKKVKPTDKPVKVSDGKGLYLLVNPTGSKLWRWKYRAAGKEKVMALGAYPDVSLTQAREGLENARKALAAGSDPMAQRKAAKVASKAAAENSSETVAREWWAQWKQARTERYAPSDGPIRCQRVPRNRCPPCGRHSGAGTGRHGQGHRGARRQRSGTTCAANLQHHACSAIRASLCV